MSSLRVGLEALVEGWNPQNGSDQLEYFGGEKESNGQRGPELKEFPYVINLNLLGLRVLVFYSNCHSMPPIQNKTLNQ